MMHSVNNTQVPPRPTQQSSFINRFRGDVASGSEGNRQSRVTAIRQMAEKAAADTGGIGALSGSPLKGKILSYSSEQELTALGSEATTVKDGMSSSNSTPISMDIDRLTMSVVREAIGQGVCGVMRRSPELSNSSFVTEVNRMSPLVIRRTYSPEEEIAMNMIDLKNGVEWQKTDLCLKSIELLKASCDSLRNASEGLPIEAQICAECDEQYEQLQMLEYKIQKEECSKKLASLERAIGQQETVGVSTYETVKKLQAECKSIYENVKTLRDSETLENQCHIQYMRLLGLLRNTFPADAPSYKILGDFSQVYQRGSEIDIPTGKSIELLGRELESLRVAIGGSENSHLSKKQAELFDEDAAYHFGTSRTPLTPEESREMHDISKVLYSMEEYESGVKQYLEFRAERLRALQILSEIKADLGRSVKKHKNPEKKLEICKSFIQFVKERKSIVVHVSQTELRELEAECNEVSELVSKSLRAGIRNTISEIKSALSHIRSGNYVLQRGALSPEERLADCQKKIQTMQKIVVRQSSQKKLIQLREECGEVAEILNEVLCSDIEREMSKIRSIVSRIERGRYAQPSGEKTPEELLACCQTMLYSMQDMVVKESSKQKIRQLNSLRCELFKALYKARNPTNSEL